MRSVEIFSATDPVHVPDRQVRYWGEFEGRKTEVITEWGPINAWANQLCDSNSDVVIVDRSDKDSGYLRAVLNGERSYGY